MGEFPQNNFGSNESLGKTVVDALIYFFYTLVYILFICPFGFWKAAAERLAASRSKANIEVDNKSRWPLFTFIIRVLYEFFFDGMMFISWFIGAFIAIICFFYTLFQGEVIAAFGALVAVLACSYYFPVYYMWLRDGFTFCLMFVRKFISWMVKPAQQVDVDFHNHAE